MKTNEKMVAFNAKMEAITTLTMEMEGEDGKNDTPDNREKLTALLGEADTIRKSIENDKLILGFKEFAKAPAEEGAGSDAFGGKSDGRIEVVKSIGSQLVESEGYKNAVKSGRTAQGMRFGFEAKGAFTDYEGKATFSSGGAGLTSGLSYVPGVVMLEQQRPMVRDLLSQGTTTLNSVPYIREASYTNGAGMVAEEGEKPEATLDIEDVTAPVKKIAVVLKVTDEMFADFPTLRSYVDGRLRFMVMSREENQILNGGGTGNNLLGILATPNVQTTSATTPGELDAIMKAITKVRSIGFYEPDAIVINPNDWEGIRLLKDAVNGQYYGGGPFTGQYGNGPFIEEPRIWGLRPVITTAITAGTALVGAFKMGAQIFQREGISVEAFNQNEDDVNYNRITLRVEERLALAVYRPLAFCTVTDIAF